ncbi:methyltransferase [Nonomuraea sp. NPDC046802]|uniref:methyltransferase n=1 Tax=Nonomuraea sp. NPDC046802 TaxID=3154919 RepID=UPI003402372E
MPSNEPEPSAWQLLAPITDLVTPMAVRVAATLRLADLIADGAGHVDELAERTGTDADALGRLLRHLTCHWSGVRHVVDAGGGVGALPAEVLRANAGVRATLVDLPDTVARGRRFLAERGLDGRCEFAGQSFFDPLPKGGEVYLLSAVLHDWGHEPATAILRRCAEAAGETGRVVIVESHGTSGDDPGMFAEMDLRMLALSGGCERSIEDYRAARNRQRIP